MTSGELKTIARELIKKNFPKIFFVSIIYLVFISVLSWFIYRLPGTIDMQNMYMRLREGEIFSPILLYRNFRPAGILFAAVIYLFRPVLDTGYMSYCLKIGRGQETDTMDNFNGFLYFAKVLLIFFLTTVFILLWSLLLIIPGIIAAYRYRLSYYVLLDDPGKSALQCITESKAIMRGHKADLFIVDLSFLGWYVLDFSIITLTPLPFMPRILMIWILPYRGIANAGFYEHCKSELAV